MPYQSKAQQRFMHAQHPDIASRWDRKTKRAKGGFAKLPERVGKAGHWSDNLAAHHQAKVDYHQGQLDRLASFKTKAQVKGATVGAKVAAKEGGKALGALGGTKGVAQARREMASPFGKKNVKQMTGPELRRRRNKGVAEALTGSAAVTLSPAALVGADAQRDRVDSHMREGRAYLADRHVKGNSAYPSPTNPRRNLSHMPSGEWVARGSTAHEAMGHRMRTVRSIAADTKKLGEIKRAVGFSRAKRVGLLAAGGAALGGGTAAMIRGGHRADTASREILAREKANRINRRANQINANRSGARQYKRSADGEFSKRLPGEKRPEAFTRHQKQAAGALTAAAAVPALMALRSGRAASVAMSEGNTALHATHAGRQLGHAATATALGGLAGATGALPVPRRILGYNHKRNKQPKIKSSGVKHSAFGKADGWDRRHRQGAAMAGAGAAGLAVSANARNIADVAAHGAGAYRGHQVRRANAKLSAARSAPKAGERTITSMSHLGSQVGLSGNAMRRSMNRPKAARIKAAQGVVNEANRALRNVPKIRHPAALGAAVGGAAVGAPLLYAGARRLAHRDVTKKITQHDVDAGAAGALGATGAYHGFSYGSKPIERRTFNNKLTPEHRATVQAHRQSLGMVSNHPAGSNEWKPFFRGYPKGVPGAKFKRTLGYTHSGKTGLAAQAALAGAGATAAVHMARQRRARTGVASKAFTRKRAHRPLHRIEMARPDTDRQFERKGAKPAPGFDRSGVGKRSVLAKKRPPGETKRDVAAGAGAVGTGAAYQAGGYAGVHRYTLKHNNVQVPRGVSQAKFDRVIGRHQRAHGVGGPPKYPLGRKVAYATGQGPMQNVKANRSWPTKIEGAHGPVKVPGAIPRRVLGFTHGGKTGLATGAAAIAAGGVAGYKGIEAHQRKKGLIKMDVTKSDKTRRHASQAAGLGAIVAGGEAADRGISGLIHQRRAADFSRKAVGAQSTLRSAKLNLRAAQGARPKTGGFRLPHVPGAGGNPAAAARHAGSIASARGARNAFHAGAAIEGAKAAHNFKVAGAAAGVTAASALAAHALKPKKPFEKKLSNRESSNLALTGAGTAIGGTGLLAAGKQVRQNTLKVAGTHALKGNLGGALSHGVRGLKVGSALDRAGAAGVGAGVLGAGYALTRRKKVGKADDMSVDAWGVVRDDMVEKAFAMPKIPTGVTKIPKIGMNAGKDAGSGLKSGLLGHPTVPKGPAGSGALKIGGMMRAHPAAAGTIGVGGTVGAASLKPKKPQLAGMVKADVTKAQGFERPAPQFFEAQRFVGGDPDFTFRDPGIADFVASPEVSSAIHRAVAVRYPQPVKKDYYYAPPAHNKHFDPGEHPLATTTGAAFAGGLAGASTPRMLRRAKKTIPKLKNAATAASTALKVK